MNDNYNNLERHLAYLINKVGIEHSVSVRWEIGRGWLLKHHNYEEELPKYGDGQAGALADRLYWTVGMSIGRTEEESVLYSGAPAMFIHDMYKNGWRYDPDHSEWNKEHLRIDHAIAVQLWDMGFWYMVGEIAIKSK